MALQRIIDNKYGFDGSEVWYDPDTDSVTVNHVQDVEPVLEDNKRKYNSSNRYRSEVLNEVANIPPVVIQQWMKEGLNIFDESPEMQKRLMQKLNSSEWRHLRTRPGRL